MSEQTANLEADFNAFDMRDPFPALALAREQQPVFYSAETDYWVVSQYEDIKNILSDWETYGSDNTATPLMPLCPMAKEIIQKNVHIGTAIMPSDPPLHTRLRRHLNKFFTFQALEKWEPLIYQLTNDAIDDFIDKREADLVSQLFYDLPALVIFEMMGVPKEDVDKIKEWAKNRLTFVWGNPDEARQIEEAHHIAAYWKYCHDLIHRQMAEPVDSLVSEIIAMRDGDDSIISVEEMINFGHALLFAGHETTTNQLSNALHLLLSKRSYWEALVDNPEMIPDAVEEIMRHSPSIMAWRRRTRKPVNIQGVDIPEGAKLLIHFGSANRDEAMFVDSDTVDFRRKNAKKNLSFGYGRHFCIGAPLARLEIRIVLEELVRRLPEMRLVEDQEFTYVSNVAFRGPAELHVTW